MEKTAQTDVHPAIITTKTHSDSEESYYDDFCVRVWFMLMTTKKNKIVLSEMVKPENKERFIESVKWYIDFKKQPEVLFSADWRFLTIYRK